MTVHIHPSAEVSSKAEIGEGSRIWHQAQVREEAQIGQNCIIGKGAYIDTGVKIGDNVKIQNYVSIYHGVVIEDGVFVGPHVCFTNDLIPRAINPDGSLKTANDWVLVGTLICQGASLGANSTIVCGVTVGAWAMVGAGSVITHSVPAHALVWGNPAWLRGFVCRCGHRLSVKEAKPNPMDSSIVLARCIACGRVNTIPFTDWEQIK